MSNLPGNFFASFLDFILSLFKKKATHPAPVQPVGIPDSPDEPASISHQQGAGSSSTIRPWKMGRNFRRR